MMFNKMQKINIIYDLFLASLALFSFIWQFI